MSFEDAIESFSRDERFKAAVCAMNSVLTVVRIPTSLCRRFSNCRTPRSAGEGIEFRGKRSPSSTKSPLSRGADAVIQSKGGGAQPPYHR